MIPVWLACALGLGFLWMGTSRVPLPPFSALDTISLVTAASVGDLGLVKSAQTGASPSDEAAGKTAVQLMQYEDGTWRLMRVQT